MINPNVFQTATEPSEQVSENPDETKEESTSDVKNDDNHDITNDNAEKDIKVEAGTEEPEVPKEQSASRRNSLLWGYTSQSSSSLVSD